MINRDRLLQRFLRYVSIHTTAIEGLDKYPSSNGQLELGRILVDELHAFGIANAKQDEHGIVMATIPSNQSSKIPVVAFNSHLDTSPETSGEDVKPQVIESYSGGDIQLTGDSTKVITTEANPELKNLIGSTLVTTDGTTLLGADDKAGVAIIMEIAELLTENPEIPHGEVRILFTCDEEIGRGVDFVDIAKVNATVCYTFDGGAANMIDNETFSADGVTVLVRGVNIHPAIAKDRMINALRAAGDFLSRLPSELSPEKTENRDGFIHPYVIKGGVAEVEIKILLRDFETDKLREHEAKLRLAAKETESAIPGCTLEVQVKKQYRNMAEGLVKEPRAVEFAVVAHKRLGREPKMTIVRGGTDGSMFTEKGLPTPNLSSGQHNLHSPLEWACLDEMVQACEIGIEILKVWAESEGE